MIRRVVLLLSVLTALAACSTAVRGSATPVQHPTTRAPVPATGEAAAGCPEPTALPECLMPLPAGSAAWSQMYAPNGTISIDQYLDRVYYGVSADQRSAVRSALATEGLLSIAHESWSTNSDAADVVLLRFGTASGAASRNAQNVHAYTADTADYRAVPIPALTRLGVNVVAYQKIDSQGDMASIGFGSFGAVLVEFFFWSPATVDQAPLSDWVTQQARALGSD